MINGGLTRRRVLEGAAGTFGMLSGGTATAQETDQFIVGIDPSAGNGETTTQTAQSAVTAQADAVRHVLDFDERGMAVAGRFSSETLDTLRQRDDVRYVEPDATGQALAQTLPWGVDRIDADLTQANSITGNGADIAIIDTGIDSDHPDLQANLGEGTSYVGCTESYDVTCYQPWDDESGHGTNCAGIAGAVHNTEGVVGVAPESTLHAVKVLDGAGTGYYSDVVAGIKWTADQGYDVGNISFGGSTDSQALADACQYAYDRGVLLVAAAGFGVLCSNCVRYPARYPTVIAVSATTKDDRLASFSATGPEIELTAPGRDIYTTDIYTTDSGGYDVTYGTSLASAHVAGTAGLLMANGYTNTEARQRLQETAEDIGLTGTAQGYGLVDAEAAVKDSFQPPQIIEIRGTGERADYTFSVSGTLQPGSGLSGEDSILGQTATGAVRGGVDQYQFSGDITNFLNDGSVQVFVNGVDRTIELTNPADRITIDGLGTFTSYDFTVTGEIAPTRALTTEDSISADAKSASGAVRGGSDAYMISGDITTLNVDSRARVNVDDAEKTITILGEGALARYQIVVSGSLRRTSALTAEDSISADGTTATGAVRRGFDTYVYSGAIESVSIQDAVVLSVER